MTEERRRVLVTGAAGRIGGSFWRHATDMYDLRLAIRNTPIDDPGPHEVVDLELSDLGSCQAACAGMDTVVHMGGTPSPASPWEVLLDSNIVGVYNILRAAADQGCRRVVLASSVRAIEGYPVDQQVRTEMPVWPRDVYGACKCFAEALCRYYGTMEGLSCIAVRIGSFDSERMRKFVDSHRATKYVTQRDMNQLLVRCVEVPGVDFAIVHGISNNRYKRLDLSSTKELLSYDPQDDGFELFRECLGDMQLWPDPDAPR